MRLNTKNDQIIGREVITLRELKNASGGVIEKGETCNILWDYGIHGCLIMSGKAVFIKAKLSCFTDDFKLTITHYECIKDDKILLSSDEPIKVESIEEFKRNVHKLIVCDEVKVTYKAETR